MEAREGTGKEEALKQDEKTREGEEGKRRDIGMKRNRRGDVGGGGDGGVSEKDRKE